MVEADCKYIPYCDTGFLKRTVLDYLAGKEDLKEFYNYPPDEAGIARAIASRSSYPVDRQA